MCFIFNNSYNNYTRTLNYTEYTEINAKDFDRGTV